MSGKVAHHNSFVKNFYEANRAQNLINIQEHLQVKIAL